MGRESGLLQRPIYSLNDYFLSKQVHLCGDKNPLVVSSVWAWYIHNNNFIIMTFVCGSQGYNKMNLKYVYVSHELSVRT